MSSIPVIQWKLNNNAAIAKNSNDEIVSILDISVRTGALFLQIDITSVSRL